MKTFEEFHLFKTKKEKLQDKLESGKLKPFLDYYIETKVKYYGMDFLRVPEYYYYMIYNNNFDLMAKGGESKFKVKSLLKAIKYIKDNLVDKKIKITEEDPYGEELWDTNEAVKLSSYRPYHNIMDTKQQEEYKEYFKKFPEHDKNYYRIYFDIKIDPSKWEIEIPQEIKDYMDWYRYPIIDYNKGICLDKDGREIRIGRLFYKLGRKDLLKAYEDSKLNTLKEGDYKVVISRHPYDIIGQSTGRGWSSCMDLNDERYNKEFVESWYGLSKQLKQGHLATYLIRKDDKNIEKPISRIMIVRSSWPYGSLFKVDKESILRVDDKHIYGAKPVEYIEFLDKWVYDFNNRKK